MEVKTKNSETFDKREVNFIIIIMWLTGLITGILIGVAIVSLKTSNPI